MSLFIGESDESSGNPQVDTRRRAIVSDGARSFRKLIEMDTSEYLDCAFL